MFSYTSDRNSTFEICLKSEGLLENNFLWHLKGELGLLLISFVLVNKHYQRLISREKDGSRGLENIPQPPALPLVGHIHHFLSPKTDRLKLFLDWALEYGSIFRMKLGAHEFYTINDPAMIRNLLNSTDSRHLNKPHLYSSLLEGALSKGLVNLDFNLWNPHRKILSRSFSYKGLEFQQAAINFQIKDFVKQFPTAMAECVGKGEAPHINRMIHDMMIKSTLRIILGSEMESDEARLMFLENFHIAKITNARRIHEPWLLIRPIWWLHPSCREFWVAKENMDLSVLKILASYKLKRESQTNGTGGAKEAVDEVGGRIFKCMMEEMLDAGMSDEDILNECITILAAGHETTSISLVFLLFQLALNPEHQEKCREEVDSLFESKMGRGDLTAMDVELSMDDLANLKYLGRCVNENLRLVPSIPGFMRRLDAPIKLDDKIELPAGVNVGIAPWTLHRLPEIYPDPERFNPDRFLPENVKNRHPYAYLPFSGGVRNCIGWKTGLLNIKMAAAWILRFYEIRTSDKWGDVRFLFHISVETEKEVNLILNKRVL